MIAATPDETAARLASALVRAGRTGSGRRIALSHGPASGSGIIPLMDRRAFLGTAIGGLLAGPLGAEAQPTGKVYRMVIVFAAMPVAEMAKARDPFQRVLFVELRRLGYVEGQNLVVERRSAAGRRENYPDVAREIVRLAPDVIYAGSGAWRRRSVQRRPSSLS